MNWYRVVVLAWLLTMVSCGLFGGKGEDEETKPEASSAPKLIGRVASINEKQRFVLIEGYGEWKLGEGLLLSSFGGENERSATLTVSGERMGRFTAADWKSGKLNIGDQVYARPLKSEKESSDGEILPESGSESGAESVNLDKKESGSD